MRKLNLKHLIFTIVTFTFAMMILKQPVYGAGESFQYMFKAPRTFLTLGGQTGQSRDNSLSDLTISPGTLSPDFYFSTLRYMARVPGDVESVEVVATPNHPEAEIVSITGDDDLSVGENIVQIRVEAQDGSLAIYQITVIREEAQETQETKEDDIVKSYQDFDEPEDKIDDMESKEVKNTQYLLDESNTNLSNLQKKYDSDINMLFRIIVVLGIVGIILLVLLVGVAYRNRALTEELLELKKGNEGNITGKGLEFKNNVSSDSKGKTNDIDGDYYFEEIDE